MPKINFTTPVGRLVMGSLTTPQTTDADGKPLLVKSGANAGKPTQKFFIAVAIPKEPGHTHWGQTAWGAKIWKAGHSSMPQQAVLPSFAWKVQDGDSATANKKGRKNCDNSDLRGCWLIMMSSSFAPKTYNKDGSAVIPAESIKCGYFVQVNADVDGNGSTQNPGVFINPSMVALSAFGEEILFGADPTAAGFGSEPLPPGAMATPPAATLAPPPTITPDPSFLGRPPAPVPMVAPPAPVPMAAPPAPVPTAAPPAPVPTAAPPAPAHQMTAAARGATYEQMISGGWSDAMLIQHGMMLA